MARNKELQTMWKEETEGKKIDVKLRIERNMKKLMNGEEGRGYNKK